MKKINLILALCIFSLIAACSSDNIEDGNQNVIQEKSISKYINLDDLKKDSNLFSKFQELQTDLNTLRNSETFANHFIFLINTENILLVEEKGFTTLTFPLYRSQKSEFVENLVLQIGTDGTYESYHVKYSITDADKSKITTNKEVSLENKVEIVNIRKLIENLNSKSTNRLITYASKCYQLAKKKETGMDEADEILIYEFTEVTCTENVGSPTYTVIDPNTLPPIVPNTTYVATPETAYNYMQNPYTLGYNFSSYPVLDDPTEENNVRARIFFDRLTTNMRKWALVNSGLYDRILVKLTAENWDLNYEEFALNVLAQITDFQIEYWATITPEYQEKVFNMLLAGGKITN